MQRFHCCYCRLLFERVSLQTDDQTERITLAVWSGRHPSDWFRTFIWCMEYSKWYTMNSIMKWYMLTDIYIQSRLPLPFWCECACINKVKSWVSFQFNHINSREWNVLHTCGLWCRSNEYPSLDHTNLNSLKNSSLFSFSGLHVSRTI